MLKSTSVNILLYTQMYFISEFALVSYHDKLAVNDTTSSSSLNTCSFEIKAIFIYLSEEVMQQL